MNPWKTLNIEPTDDKKAIKKAYAVLIKQYKPDEYPEKFKEIQAAYQSALEMLKWQAEEKFDKPLKEMGIKKQSRKVDFIFETAVELDEDGLEELRQQDELIENLYKQLHTVTHSSIAFKSNIENWKFVENFNKIENLNLKLNVAQLFFKKVAESNSYQMDYNNTLLIHPTILKYFNQIFQWSEYSMTYQDIFPNFYFEVTFKYFDNKVDDSYARSLFDSYSLTLLRVFSIVLDMFFGLLYTLMFFVISFKFYNYQNMSDTKLKLIFIAIFSLYYFCSELLTINKSSIGKKISLLVVTDNYGNMPLKRVILFRHVIVNLLLLLYIYLPILNLGDTLFVKISSTIFVILSLYTLVTKRGFIHDVLTCTMVIRQENLGSIDITYDEVVKIRKQSKYRY